MDEQIRVADTATPSGSPATCYNRMYVPEGNWILDMVSCFAVGTTGTPDGTQAICRVRLISAGQGWSLVYHQPVYPSKPLITLHPEIVVHAGEYVEVFWAYCSATTSRCSSAILLRRPEIKKHEVG